MLPMLDSQSSRMTSQEAVTHRQALHIFQTPRKSLLLQCKIVGQNLFVQLDQKQGHADGEPKLHQPRSKRVVVPVTMRD